MKVLQLVPLLFTMFLGCVEAPNASEEPEAPPAYRGEWGSWGSGDGEFKYTSDVGIGPDGKVYVADRWNYRIQYFTPAGSYLGKWGTQGEGKGEFENEVKMLAVGPEGNVYIPDGEKIMYFDSTGRFLGEWITPHRRTLGIDVAEDGTVYVAEWDEERERAGVRRFTSSGSFLGLFTGSNIWSEGPLEALEDVAVFPGGDVFTLEFPSTGRVRRWSYDGGRQKNSWYTEVGAFGIGTYINKRIYVSAYYELFAFTDNGSFLYRWGKKGAGPGEFDGALRFFVARDGTLYVADTRNSRVQYFH
jgi:tripartite motif-containing protein 71